MDGERARRGVGACVWSSVLSALWPGVGHVWARLGLRRVGLAVAALNAAATVFLAIVLIPVDSRSELATVVAHRSAFVGIGTAIAVMAVTRIVAATESAWLTKPATGARRGPRVVLALATSTALVATAVVPLAMAAEYVWETDRTIERIFGNDGDTTAMPAPLDPPSDTASGTTTADTIDATTTTTTRPFVGVDRVNVLLLGGDSGPGRWSMRTDTMIVVSIDPDDGDTVLISVPRNLPSIEFPPGTPLAERFPDGFDNIANAVWTYVDQHRELAGGGDDAGAQAIKQGIAQLLGIPIQYYVLVEMAGFVRVVDALGGIDVNVLKRVPTPGNPSTSMRDLPDWFEVGQQHMDGVLALAYARSRAADNDYGRMSRQRCVLAGISSAATPRVVAVGLSDLLDAIGDAVTTDIPRDRLPELSKLVDRFAAHGGMATVRTLPLTPPAFEPSTWKSQRQYIRDVVTNTLEPGTLMIDMPWVFPVVTEECELPVG